MTERVFTPDDQLAFAKLSGDYNPLHLDPVLARRLLYGCQVVHGLHALLWGLDDHLGSWTQPLELRTVKANFQAAIGVGQKVRCLVTQQDEYRIAVKLEADGTAVAWIEVTWSLLRQHRTGTLPRMSPAPQECRERPLEEVATASGGLALYIDGDLAGGLFPNLIRVLPLMQLADLLATTRLVGMECPGHHSIYSSLNLAFFPERAGVPSLTYRVTDCNQRLALVSMDVAAPGVKGEVKAFLRPNPQRQAAFTEVCRRVESEEFSGQQALIVGGSRGLGEVTAKLLAAGGAEVILTYYRGREDARRIVEEIVSQGAKAHCLSLNVLEPLPGLPGKIANCSKPLYLYYFATPHIFGAAKGKFSSQRFATFCEFYVSGFLRTVASVADAATGLQKVFYPSSTAIEELPLDMGEYAAAKMAGEILCEFLQKAHPGLVIYKPRLPRVATDQTVSLLPVGNQEPVSILLSNLRCLRQM
ncbi:MAG: SDR family NAD(P)-dependent oxidoreductase [Desulfobacterales bacterium]|nr:MAG: SDR family NAD(P)-dependent oxidoreductase [Desulfobacterales bacterium]